MDKNQALTLAIPEIILHLGASVHLQGSNAFCHIDKLRIESVHTDDYDEMTGACGLAYDIMDMSDFLEHCGIRRSALPYITRDNITVAIESDNSEKTKCYNEVRILLRDFKLAGNISGIFSNVLVNELDISKLDASEVNNASSMFKEANIGCIVTIKNLREIESLHDIIDIANVKLSLQGRVSDEFSAEDMPSTYPIKDAKLDISGLELGVYKEQFISNLKEHYFNYDKIFRLPK